MNLRSTSVLLCALAVALVQAACAQRAEIRPPAIRAIGDEVLHWNQPAVRENCPEGRFGFLWVQPVEGRPASAISRAATSRARASPSCSSRATATP